MKKLQIKWPGRKTGTPKKRRKVKKKTLIIGSAAAAAVIVAGAFLLQRRQQAASADAQVQRTATVQKTDITSTLTASGSLSAKDTYNITSLVEGKC